MRIGTSRASAGAIGAAIGVDQVRGTRGAGVDRGEGRGVESPGPPLPDTAQWVRARCEVFQSKKFRLDLVWTVRFVEQEQNVAKALKAVYGPVLGLVLDGPKGLLRGVANLATVVIGGPAAAIGQVVGFVGALFSKSGPTVPTSQSQRLVANIDPRAFRKTVFGQTAMPAWIEDE